MIYSPKLKKAMEEIKDIIKKHDIGAAVYLHTPGFSEHYKNITPSYTCLSYDGNNVRLRVKASEVGSEKAHELANDSYNLLTHFATLISNDAVIFMELEQTVRNILGGESYPGTSTSIQEQDN